MIALSTQTFDPLAPLVFPRLYVANPYDTYRRGTVTATLDGGVSVYDTGYSEADMTFKVAMKEPTRDQLIHLRYLISYYNQLTFCCESGAFLVIGSMTSTAFNMINLQFRVVARLDRGY